MEWLLDNLDGIRKTVEAVALIIAGASILANRTKTDKDNKAVGTLSKVVNFLALNLDKLPRKPKQSDFNK